MEDRHDKTWSASIDAVLPKEMAKRAERTGVEKVEQGPLVLLALGGLAGAFVAFGAMFAAAVTVGAPGDMSIGLASFLGGLAFSLSYVLAVVGGAELFTTNNMMVMAWAHGRLPILRLLRAWGMVFAGNFAGAAATAAMQVLAGQHAESGGAVGQSLLASAARLRDLTMIEALFLGILGNTLLFVLASG